MVPTGVNVETDLVGMGTTLTVKTLTNVKILIPFAMITQIVLIPRQGFPATVGSDTKESGWPASRI